MKRFLFFQFLFVIYASNSFAQNKNSVDTATREKEVLRWIPAREVNFEKPAIEAEFPGGEDGWAKFIEKNLNRKIPINNQAPRGEYIIVVWFTIGVDGNLSHIISETNYGYGMEDEVIRVLKTSPKWEPAINKKHTVPSSRKQTVVFVVR